VHAEECVELKWASKAGSVVCRMMWAQLLWLAVAGLSFGCGTRAMAAPRVLPRASAAAPPKTSQRSQILRNYARLPLSFEPNLGQSNLQIKFLAHGEGYGLFLTANRALLSVRVPVAHADGQQARVLSLQLLGANSAARVFPEAKMAGVSNYLLGGDPGQWHTNVPHYARVHYAEIYPGVDLVYYGRQRQLEYDFVLAPGADPNHIRLHVEGAQGLSLNREGELVMALPGGAIQMLPPVAYQQVGQKKHLVAARYLLENGNQVALRLGDYDRSRALVIDPQVSYSSYLGGTGNETAPAVAVDAAFNAYVAGTTASTNFPTTAGALQTSLKGTTTNVFITKFNSTGTGVLFSTYLGSTGTDSAAGIAVDSGFNAYVAGTTNATDFPIITAKAVPDTPATAGTNHVFVSELNPSGSGLIYSTYLAGNGADTAKGVAVGPQAGTVFATGTTTSINFAGVTKPAGRGTSQFFVTKLNTGKQGAASLVYSTYVGGSTPSTALTDGGGIAVDTAGNAYITGGTNYSDMPVVNAFQAGLNGTENSFVAKLDANGLFSTKSFLTYLGGNGTDIGNGIAVDAGGNAYVTGTTTSSTFPVLAATGSSIYQGTFSGTSDAFLTKVAAAGTSLIWSTFIGGSGVTSGAAVAVDGSQNAFVTGSTDGGLAVINATNLQGTYGGGATDAFVGKFDISGGAQFVTYRGGSGDDHGTGIALDSSGNPYVAGDTTSTGLATSGAFQSALNGTLSDAFVTHYIGISTLSMAAAVTPNPIGIGNAAVFTFTITNTGPDAATAVVFTDTLPGNGTFQSAATSQGACSPPAGSTFSCSLGQLPNGATATVTVHITATTAGPLSDSATVASSSPTGGSSAGVSTTVSDYTVSLSPAAATVADGQAATYTVTVSPVPANAGFPNGVSLKCVGSTVPTATLCAFSTNPVIPNGTPVTSSLTISTTAPIPGTTAALFSRDLRRIYALMLPLGGIAFLGFGLGGDGRRRKRVAGLFLLLLVLGVTALQPACSSSSNKATPPPFTPTGTYKITVQAVSGPVVRSTTLKLVVQ